MVILYSLPAHAQVAGNASFKFLNTPGNARLAAMGGVNVSLVDRDINFFNANPALAGDTLSGLASASYQSYLAGINQVTFSYGRDFQKIGMITAGIQHLSYGTINGYDATGADLGAYKSGETAIVFGKSHQVNNFRFGANLKAVFSNITGYTANAVMVDLGGVFIHPKKNLTVGLVMKNVGVVLSNYTEFDRVKIPIDIQVGASVKPEHMPLRFSVTAYNLVASTVTYYTPQAGNEKPGTLDKVLRRFNFASEVLFHKNVNVMIGYNYLMHQELKLSNGGGGAGITFGLSARVKSAEFVLSRGGYVAGKAGYTFTVSINTQKILTRRQGV